MFDNIIFDTHDWYRLYTDKLVDGLHDRDEFTTFSSSMNILIGNNYIYIYIYMCVCVNITIHICKYRV